MSADNQNNLLKCEICGNYYKSITNTHLKNKHNMTTEEYKLQFPDSKMIRNSHFNKLAEWIYSEQNSAHWRLQADLQRDSTKRKENAKMVAKSDEYRRNHSKIMKQVVRDNPEKFRVMHESIRGEEHHHYGKSNWQRWYESYGKEEADKRLLDWKRKNKIPGGSKNTKIELKVKKILNDNSIKYIHQFDRISGMYNDFYLPEYNLIIEVDGDYWHANPNKYEANQLIKYPGNRLLKAKDVWEKDKKRDEVIKENGYFVSRIFESDITEKRILSIIENFD